MLPPSTIDELFSRATLISGRTLGWLADQQSVPVPAEPRRAKGWMGQRMEAALGATAGSAAMPDFPHLHVELKTLPVDARGKPLESTYVCTAPLDGTLGIDWASSWVRAKLAQVLFVPVIGERGSALGDRVIGSPLLWRPNPEEEAMLRSDWEELARTLSLGEVHEVDARRGKALQLRPKARDSSTMTWTLDTEGEWIQTNPVGFYLRPSFTSAILARAFLFR